VHPGTYLYHGHVAQAKVGGFTGLLVVEPNPEKGIDWPLDWKHDGIHDFLVADRCVFLFGQNKGHASIWRFVLIVLSSFCPSFCGFMYCNCSYHAPVRRFRG